MDALFQTQSNELSTITQKEKLFKDAERQWNTPVSYTHLDVYKRQLL